MPRKFLVVVDDSPEFEATAGAWLLEEVIGATGLPEYDTDRQDVLRIRAERPVRRSPRSCCNRPHASSPSNRMTISRSENEV